MTRVTLIFFLFCSVYLQAQEEIVLLDNPSFEGIPHAGDNQYFLRILGWEDCGRINFRGETPPDIHRGIGKDQNVQDEDLFFGVRKQASDGKTFLGMVARENETYESVSQKLSSPLYANHCYEFSIDLSKSDYYLSPYPRDIKRGSKLYTKAIVMRIFGGNNTCGKRELLAESDLVDNVEWKTFEFIFKPTLVHQYITIEAFYKTPILMPYNGNLLVDNASPIVLVPCPDEEEQYVENTTEPIVEKIFPKETPDSKEEKPIEIKSKEETSIVKNEVPEKIVPGPEKKEKINKSLERSFMKKGQKFNINNLYFKANDAEIDDKSFDSLDELVVFLQENNDVRIEIGGHTNGRPNHSFCDSLSLLRAQSVEEYLTNKGIPKTQIKAKGYGKRDPIASNDTKAGRRKNQRVEIKVLSIDNG